MCRRSGCILRSPERDVGESGCPFDATWSGQPVATGHTTLSRSRLVAGEPGRTLSRERDELASDVCSRRVHCSYTHPRSQFATALSCPSPVSARRLPICVSPSRGYSWPVLRYQYNILDRCRTPRFVPFILHRPCPAERRQSSAQPELRYDVSRQEGGIKIARIHAHCRIPAGRGRRISLAEASASREMSARPRSTAGSGSSTAQKANQGMWLHPTLGGTRSRQRSR
jgi:hypothetical protein